MKPEQGVVVCSRDAIERSSELAGQQQVNTLRHEAETHTQRALVAQGGVGLTIDGQK